MKTTMKKALCAAIATLMLTSTALAAAPATQSFSDVKPADWSFGFVEKAAKNGLVQGTGEGKFSPTLNVSYQDWAVMLTNLFFYEELGNTPSYPTDYLKVAEETGLFERTQYTNSKSVSAISRYDMAQSMYNLSNTQDWDSLKKGEQNAFDSVSAYSNAVMYCSSVGFIAGTSSTEFGGTQPMVREAAATVLCRLFDADNGMQELTEETPPEEKLPETKPETSTPKAVKDMITITPNGDANGGYKKYIITLDVPEYNGKTLSNGKPITEENILDMLDELKEIFPQDTPWSRNKDGKGDHYRYTGIDGCNSFTYMTRDILFGKGSMGWAETHSDFSRIKTGDVVNLKNNSTGFEHWAVVIKVESDRYYTCDGNYDAKVSWSENNAGHLFILTEQNRPDSTIYSFY